MTQVPAIARSTLAHQSRQALLDLILGGRLPAGERINESRLAGELGVSRTPLREALAGLARDNFLVGEAGRGYWVSQLTEGEASELYPILGLLEGATFRFSTVGPEDLAALADLNRRLAEGGPDPEEAIAANFAWHERLLETCSNRRLVTMVKGLWMQVRRYEFAFFAPGAKRVRQSVALHDGILAAIGAGDMTRAQRLMEEHWLTDLGDLIPRMEE